MPVIQLVLLIVVLIGLGAFASQNWLPTLSVVFLGMQTQALPLAVWILLAIALGFITSLVLQLLNHLSRRPLVARIRELEPTYSTPYTTNRRVNRQPSPPSTEDDSDWDDDSASRPKASQEWEDEEQSTGASSSENVNTQTNYEVKQKPKTSSQSGSTYSHSYRDPSNSGVGKSEAVYEASYRVITPPYSGTPQNEKAANLQSKGEEDEDWGFEDEDDFEAETPSDRPPQRP